MIKINIKKHEILLLIITILLLFIFTSQPSTSINNPFNIESHEIYIEETNICYGENLGFEITIDNCKSKTWDGTNIKHNVKFKWNGNNTISADFIFVYENEIDNGNIYLYKNISQIETIYYTDENNNTIGYDVITFKMEWIDVTDEINYLGYNINDQGFYYYNVKSITFNPNEEIFTKWIFTPKDKTKNGKWHIFGKLSSSSLRNSIQSGNYIYIDPSWFSTNYQFRRNITNITNVHLTGLMIPINATGNGSTDIDGDTNLELIYCEIGSGEETSIYYNNTNIWICANTTAQLYGVDVLNNVTTGTVPDNLKFWIPFQNATGARDFSQNNIDGVYNGNLPNNVSYIIGDAQSGAGNPDYINWPNDADIQFGDVDLTILFWSRIHVASETLLGKNDDGNSGILINAFVGNTIRFGLYNGGAGIIGLLVSTNTYNLNEPVFVATRHDAVNNFISIKIDNQSVEQLATSGAFSSGTSPLNVLAGIGGSPVVESYCDCEIDELMFIEEMLSNSSLEALYSAYQFSVLGEQESEIDFTAPNIDFINQTPPDYNINNLNLFANLTSIFNITDIQGVNDTLVNLTAWFSPDNGTTLNPTIHIINGVADNHVHNFTSVSGSEYTWFWEHPHIIRGTMATDPDLWNNGINDSNSTITNNLDKRTLRRNITVIPNSTNIFMYPIDVSGANQDLLIYIGNITGCFETGIRVQNSNNWRLLDSINNSEDFDFNDLHIASITIDENNITNGLIFTETMCIQTNGANNAVNPVIWKGINIGIPNMTWDTSDDGITLIENTTVTPRFMIHYGLLNESAFCYQVNATDINNNTNSISVFCDLYGIGLVPVNPILNFANPSPDGLINGTININGSVFDVDNSGFTSVIELFYINGTLRLTINNSGNENLTSFTFNTSLVLDDDYFILWTITSGNGGTDSESHNVTVDNIPPSILEIPIINENQSFEGINITIYLIILLLMGSLFLINLYSNDIFIILVFSSIYLILWIVIILPSDVYRIILVSETFFAETDCLSVVVSGVCDITRLNSTTSFNYGRELINIPFRFKSGLLFLGVLSLSKIVVIKRKRKNELLNVTSMED